jgi:hypothetical protein
MVKIPLFALIIASLIVPTACPEFNEFLDILDSKEPLSITITALPSKTIYITGETFDSTGLVITASYFDGTSADVTGYTLSKPNMASAGIKPITVTFQRKTASFDITVDAVPVAITVFREPVKTIYITGETFDPTGLVVRASYSDGSSGVITEYTLSKPNMSSVGTQSVTVTFEGKTASFNIKVAAVAVTITGITVTANPAKIAYYVNDVFDPTGLKVTAAYSDGSSGLITGYSLSAPNMSSVGPKPVTVTHSGKTASFDITVTEAPGASLTSITVTANPVKTAYSVNEAFNPTGLEVTAHYLNGSSGLITEYTLSTPDMSGAGTKTITVTFEGKTANFNITVAAVTLTSITVTANPVKTTYHVNDVFDPTGLVITAHYSNGSSEVITDYTLSTPDMASAGTKTITVTFEGKTAGLSITVNPVSNDTGGIDIIVY